MSESLSIPLPSSPEDVPRYVVKYLVVNPFDVVLSLPKLLPARSAADVVTFILYVVKNERLSEGVNVKVVLSVVEIVEDISIQLEKLSLDSCTEPEQVVPDVLVLTLSIASENVTEMDEDGEVMLSEFDGEVDLTVGAVVSILNALILSVTESFPAGSLTVIVQSV